MLQEASDINHGIGSPILNLAVFLLVAWLIIAAVLVKGIRSSGKASYFLALFPYVIIGVLLIRALTLDGAMNGIIYFITPRWDKILDPDVSFYYSSLLLLFNICSLYSRKLLGLVCSCDSMLLFIGCWFWQHYHVFIVQQI